jgi:hypothetical protein
LSFLLATPLGSAAFAPQPALVHAAALGAALAFASRKRPEWLCALATVAAGAAALLWPGSPWPVALCGALIALGFAARRREDCKESGARLSAGAILLGAALCPAALLAARASLPELALELAQLVPALVAQAIAGALLGLWIAAACAPLHVSLQADPVEAKLASLRAILGPELRALAERAVSARSAAAAALPAGSRGDLRGLLDALALAALELARRGAELGRAASPFVEQELSRRTEALAKSAAEAGDTPARASYQRAADTTAGQLEQCRKLHCARERLLARLHEEIAQLERARFALTMLDGADAEHGSAELELLGERLQQSIVEPATI